MNKLLSIAALSLASLGVGIAIRGLFVGEERCSVRGRFPYINQQLDCGPEYTIDKQAYIGFKNTLEGYISDQETAGVVSEVSVYFRDLYNGPTLGIDEHENFSPASLLKLPLLLAYLDYQLENPSILSDQLVITSKNLNLLQFYQSQANLEMGVEYTVDELLEAMIVDSDNDAYYTLLAYLIDVSGRDVLAETYIDLGLLDPTSNNDETLSTKAYASIFSQLYHSSFLSTQDLSNQALTLLARSDFDAGIRAGIPQSIQVAHKFGERSDLPNNEKQLHDCGIVYYPDNAYLLCVMTRGKDFTELEKVIQDISAKVYAEFDSRRL